MVIGLSACFVIAVNCFLSPGGTTRLSNFSEVFPFALFSLLLFSGSINLIYSLAGFIVWLANERSRPKLKLKCSSDTFFSEEIASRISVVMPIYNEDCDQVYCGIRATWLSIKRAHLDKYCDFYILSDTNNPAIQSQEEKAHKLLRDEFGVYPSILSDLGDITSGLPTSRLGRFFLLRREHRISYKGGNIANFLVRHGRYYDFMLVLDADSVMLGRTLKRMVLRMEHNPKVAILQSVIVPIASQTLFSRAMQFTFSRCLPLYSIGLNWFLGRESVYWGHNALIRIQPFMRHASLPLMPGKPPFGGPVMSQDIVEAALLGREGWAVEWDLEADGSFDEMPANILSYGRRDRRWCQGNFQHFWLIFGDRFRFGHRFYFALGIMAYLGAPLLLLLMLLGFLQGLGGLAYPFEPMVFWSFLLFIVAMLAVPRVLGLARMLLLNAPRVNTGRKLLNEAASTALEFLFSFLIAPLLFYLHTRFVMEILTGRKIEWVQQGRNPTEEISWANARQTFLLPTILGILWLGLTWHYTPGYLPYFSPILFSWILSIPIAVLTSKASLGRFLAHAGLFQVALSHEEREELCCFLRYRGTAV